MSVKKTTEELVRSFNENPGAENIELEFKSKDVLNSKGQKKKIVRILSAMANRLGGTMIIGVRRENGDVRIQGFKKDTEARQELTHIADQYTNPPLTYKWDLKFDDCLGSKLLRIDVEKAVDDLVKFDYGGDYTPWVREEDGMREMTVDEISSFFRRRRSQEEATSLRVIERVEHVDFKPPQLPNPKAEEEISHRAITRVNEHYTVVFGHGLTNETLRKSHTYSLGTQLSPNSGYSTILEVIQKAEEHLDAWTDQFFGYTIRVGDAELIGWSVSSLQEDFSRLSDIYEKLQDISKSGWNYGPVVAGYTRTDYGFLWFEIQRESSNFVRGELELVLPDVPFDDSRLRVFFDDLDASPMYYDHECGLQYITLQGSQVEPLHNPNPVPMSSDQDEPIMSIMVDNPTYGWPDVLESELDEPIPDSLKTGISSIKRIPFQVSGGYVSREDERFALNYLHYTQVSGTHPTLLVEAHCWPR